MIQACPLETILVYWMQNLPAWIGTAVIAYFTYQSAKSWKEEYTAKRRVEVAEKILTSAMSFVSELKKCRSKDSIYPFEASAEPFDKKGAKTVAQDWFKKYGAIKPEIFIEFKHASMLARVYFSKEASDLMEELISLRLKYIEAFKACRDAPNDTETYILNARILCPTKADDDIANRMDSLLSEIESKVLGSR